MPSPVTLEQIQLFSCSLPLQYPVSCIHKQLLMPSSSAPSTSKHKQKASWQEIKQSFDLSETKNNPADVAPTLGAINHSIPSIGYVDPLQKPQNWPATITYLKQPFVSPYLSEQQRQWLQKKPSITCAYSDVGSGTTGNAETTVPVIKLPVLDIAERIEIRPIQDAAHPAYGQHGLFTVRDLSPGSFILPYFGYVHSSSRSERNESESQQLERESSQVVEDCSVVGTEDNVGQPIGSWDKSDYDLNLYRDEKIELAIDAALMGNEARFCNDYRGVPAFTDSATAANEKNWNRKAKRAAKTQSFDNDPSSASTNDQKWRDHDIAVAIPNSEFRDVWFEWTTNDGEEHKSEGKQCVPIPDRTDEAMQRMRVDSTAGVRHGNISTEYGATSEMCRSRPGRRRRKDKTGIRGVAIFVLPAGKSGKRKNGIKTGQEVLVSYGKGFWAHHAG